MTTDDGAAPTRRNALVAAAGLLLSLLLLPLLVPDTPLSIGDGLRIDPSTSALIDPDDLTDDGARDDALMLMLSATQPLDAPALSAFDTVVAAVVSATEAAGSSGNVTALTRIALPMTRGEDLEILSIADILARKTSPADADDLATLLAHPLLQGRLISDDGTAGGIRVDLPSGTDADHQRMARAIVAAARQAATDTPLTLAATGAPLVQGAIADSLRGQLQRVLPLLALAFGAVLLGAFRCGRLVLVAAVSVALAVLWSLAALVLIGGSLNLVTSLVVPLIATLTVAYQMHVLTLREHVDSAVAAARQIGLPLLVTAVTTAVGLIALAIHPTPAIRSFAIAAALGTLVSAAITRLWTPHAMDWVGACPTSVSPVAAGLGRMAERIAAWDIRHAAWILRGAVAVLVFGLAGTTQLQTGANLINDLPASNAVRSDYQTVTSQLWSTTGFSIRIRSSAPDAMLEPDLLAAVADIQDWLDAQPEVDGSYGLVNILRELYARLGSPDSDGALPDNPTLAKQLIIAAGPQEVYDYTNLRFSEARIHVGTALQNTREITDLTDRVSDRLASLPSGLDVALTGNAVTFTRTVNKLTSGQAWSFAAALVAIFVILAVVFASLRAAAFAMLPNLVPVALFFGLIGWSGLGLGPTTTLVACIVLGIAVDDTLHYLVRFNSNARASANAVAATRQTLRDVIRPVTLTTLATVLGFLTLTLSPFESQVTFAWLAAATLASAWLVDLTLAPVIGLRADVVTLWDVLRVDLGRAPQDSIPLLDGMSARQARVFALLSNLRTISAGTQFITAGDTAKDIYVIVEGTARVWLDRADGPLTLNTLGRGTTLGEVGYFAQRRTANVTAQTDLRVLDFDTSDLERLRIRHPRVAALVYRNLNAIQAERLVRATRQIAELREVGGT